MPAPSQCYCRDCGHQWYPPGPGLPPRCRVCGGPRVAPVLSLDDAEPPPPPPPQARGGSSSALPLLLGLGMLGTVLLTASGVVVYALWDRPPARPAEHAPATTPAGGTITPAGTAQAAPTTPAGTATEPPELPTKQPAAKKSTPGEPAGTVGNDADRTAPDPVPPVVNPRPGPAPIPGATDPKLAPPDLTPPPTTAPMVPAPTPGATNPAAVPRPRAAHPFPPPPGSWESAWTKLGDVRVRVCGVATTKVPVERRKREFFSDEAYFVVWLEIENVSAAAHTYRRWQPVTSGECTLRYAGGAAVPYAIYPAETGRVWFSEFNQPLPPGGPPMLESLAFSRPDTAMAGDVTLTLDASRVGGTGRYVFTIPNAVWTRR